MAARLLNEIDSSRCRHRFTDWQYVPKKDEQPRAFETASCWDTTVTRQKGASQKHEVPVWKRVCQVCGHTEYQQGCRQLEPDEI